MYCDVFKYSKYILGVLLAITFFVLVVINNSDS